MIRWLVWQGHVFLHVVLGMLLLWVALSPVPSGPTIHGSWYTTTGGK